MAQASSSQRDTREHSMGLKRHHRKDRMGFERYCRKDRMRHLENFMVPEFVTLAFHMPAGCGTFWGMMQEKIDRSAELDQDPFSTDVNDVLEFLGTFFSPSIINRVCTNFSLLRQSFLGLDYTLRYGKAVIAITLLHDIESECRAKDESPLYGFIGEESCDEEEEEVADSGEDDGGGWQRQGRRRQRQRASEHGGGGRGGPPDQRMHFQNTEQHTIMVYMSPFTTPQHGAPDRRQTLRSRSWEFVSHGQIGDLRRKLYNPHTCETGRWFVYHGTRGSSLDRFKMQGINPGLRKNEFSRDRAFYVSNSLRHAYEHPLHYHASKSVTDHVSVMVFDVDVEVLHGLKSPPGVHRPFTYRWFQDTEEDELAWQEFCAGNFNETRPPHDYDIVIGPLCKAKTWEKMKIKLADGVPLTQVAFCSEQARAWLEQCFMRVYMEVRLAQEHG